MRRNRLDQARVDVDGHYVGAVCFFVLASLTCAGCGGSSGGQNPPPHATFTTIDAPGADIASGQGTEGVSINAAGDIAGNFVDVNGVFHGFIRSSGGSIATVDAPGARMTVGLGTNVRAINASGSASGYFANSTLNIHSYIRLPNGTLTEFDPPNSISSDAFCMNDSGAVGGDFLDLNGHHGFVRGVDGTFVVIDPTGTASAVEVVVVSQINSGGAVAGHFVDTNRVYHGFLRAANGVTTILDAPGAGTAALTGTQVTDINAQGVIVGGIAVGDVNGVSGVTHSFMLAADGTYTFFELPQAVSSIAEGINDNGVVVGEYRDANLIRHGYIRQADGTFMSFDEPNASQTPTTSGNIGTEPRKINLSGEVVGFYSDSAGVIHAFIRQ